MLYDLHVPILFFLSIPFIDSVLTCSLVNHSSVHCKHTNAHSVLIMASVSDGDDNKFVVTIHFTIFVSKEARARVNNRASRGMDKSFDHLKYVYMSKLSLLCWSMLIIHQNNRYGMHFSAKITAHTWLFLHGFYEAFYDCLSICFLHW